MTTENLPLTMITGTIVTAIDGDQSKNQPLKKIDVLDSATSILHKGLATFDWDIASGLNVGGVVEVGYTSAPGTHPQFMNYTIKIARPIQGVPAPAPVAQPQVAQQPQAPAIDHLLQEFDLAPLPRINHHLLEDRLQVQRSIVRTSSLYIAKDLLIAHGKPLTVDDDDNTLDNLADMVIELTDKIEERFYKGNPVQDEGNDSTGHASRDSVDQFYDQN